MQLRRRKKEAKKASFGSKEIEDNSAPADPFKSRTTGSKIERLALIFSFQWDFVVFRGFPCELKSSTFVRKSPEFIAISSKIPQKCTTFNPFHPN